MQRASSSLTTVPSAISGTSGTLAALTDLDRSEVAADLGRSTPYTGVNDP